MRQLGKSSLTGRRGYQIWCDEAQEPASLINAASILYVIANAHLALKKVQFGNTPRQRRNRTKFTNRFKLTKDIKYHVLHISAVRP